MGKIFESNIDLRKLLVVNVNLKDKFFAAGIHLLISILVAVLILCLLYFFWFPSPLMTIGGANEGVKLILLVDLVIGPLCTLIVFKRNKPSIRFDLSVIALLQIAAISYGVFAIYAQKPSYMVLTYTELVLVNRREVSEFIPESEKWVLDELRDETLHYKGVIPFIILDEPEDARFRADSRMAFLFEADEEHYYNTANYLPVSDLSAVPALKNNKRFEEKEGCIEIPLLTARAEASICLAQKGNEIINI